jgi:Flp pilus assembly protein TadD
LSLAYARQGSAELAIGHLETFMQLTPPNAERQDELGMLYLQASRHREAQAAFERALALDPAYEPARRHLAEVQAGLAP